MRLRGPPPNTRFTEPEPEHAQRSYQQWDNYDHHQQYTGLANGHSLSNQNQPFTPTNQSHNSYTAFPTWDDDAAHFSTPTPTWDNDAAHFSTPTTPHSQVNHSSGSTGWPDDPIYLYGPPPNSSSSPSLGQLQQQQTQYSDLGHGPPPSQRQPQPTSQPEMRNVPIRRHIPYADPIHLYGPPNSSSSPSLSRLQQQQTQYSDIGHGSPPSQRQPQPTSQPQTRNVRRPTPNASSPAAVTSQNTTSMSRTTANKRKRDGATRMSPIQDKRVRISNANASDSGANGRGKVARLPRACTRCKMLKIRCDFPEDDNTCNRCKTGGHVCIIEGRKPRTAPNPHTQVLEETLAILHSISPQDEEKAALLPLLQLRGEEAQYRLDILQTIADFPRQLDQRVRFLTLQIIFRLSHNSDRYPQCYVIKNLVLGKRVARGAYGDLYKGRIEANSQAGYAVKVVQLCLDVDEKPDPHQITDCLREAVLWRQLTHPNVLPFLGMYYKDETREDVCFVSPYMNNGSLSVMLKNKTLSQEEMYTLVHDIASGLKYLHDENVIHGDLKPDNVLITNHFRACLCDFGQSRLASTRGFQPTRRQGWGTRGYTAPEVDRDGRSSKKGDVYSFGRLWYEILKKTYNLSELKWLNTNKVDTTRPERLPWTPDLSTMWGLITLCLAEEASDRPDAERLISLLNGISSEPKPAPDWDDTDPLFTQVRSNVDHGDMSPRFPVSGALIPTVSGALIPTVSGALIPTVSGALIPTVSGALIPTVSGALIPTVSGPLIPVNTPAGGFPEDLDFNSMPPEFKKEGSDWFAMFNPKLKRSLDVSLVHTLMHESVVCCLRFSPDGKYLATGCNRTAQIYDTKTGQKTCVLLDESVPKADDLYIRSVCFSPDGKFLATGAEDKLIRIWDIQKRLIRNIFEGHRQEIYSLDFSQDGRLIVSGSGDKTVRIWDMHDGTSKVLTFNDPDSLNMDAGVTSVAISPNGNFVAAGSLDTVVRIWDIASGVLVERLRGHRDSVYSVAFTSDGKGLISGSLDKTLKYWDVSALMTADPGMIKRGKEGATWNVNGPGVFGDVVGKDGEKPSQCTMNFTGHKDYVLSVAVTHDGQWVVSGSKDRGVRFWDSRTAIEQCMLQGHKTSVISVDLSPSGSLLATGSGDWQARIWSYNTV